MLNSVVDRINKFYGVFYTNVGIFITRDDWLAKSLQAQIRPLEVASSFFPFY